VTCHLTISVLLRMILSNLSTKVSMRAFLSSKLYRNGPDMLLGHG
jgi:hypothetical protein